MPCTAAVHCVALPVLTPDGLQVTETAVIVALGVAVSGTLPPQPVKGTAANTTATQKSICVGKMLKRMILAWGLNPDLLPDLPLPPHGMRLNQETNCPSKLHPALRVGYNVAFPVF